MDVPCLDISQIQGGLFKVKTSIKNIGVAEAEDVNWVISLEGGTIFFGRSSSGSFTSLDVDAVESISSRLILGFGDVRVRVSVSGSECSDDRDQGGSVFLFWIKVNPGGGS